MNNVGMLVYPVIVAKDEERFCHVHNIFSEGTFFLDKNEGYKFQMKMEETDDRYDYWTNSLLKYQ